jgi:hypothetical protein
VPVERGADRQPGSCEALARLTGGQVELEDGPAEWRPFDVDEGHQTGVDGIQFGERCVHGAVGLARDDIVLGIGFTTSPARRAPGVEPWASLSRVQKFMLMTIPMIDARGPLRCSAKYKARIFEEYEALNKEGKGALLRREGLYSSLILGVAKTTRPGCARGAYAQGRLARSSQ